MILESLALLFTLHGAHTTSANTSARSVSAPSTHTDSYGLYDSVEPEHIKGDQNHGMYASGPYAAKQSPANHGNHRNLWIDTNGSRPEVEAVDVEPGDVTPEHAGDWVKQHDKASDKPAIVYTMKSQWAAAKADVAKDAPGAHVKWWIADPTGHPHDVKGADATQWGWFDHIDISSVHNPSVFWEGHQQGE